MIFEEINPHIVKLFSFHSDKVAMIRTLSKRTLVRAGSLSGSLEGVESRDSFRG